MPTSSTDEYHVGWVCALPIEMAAAEAMLDEEYEPLRTQDDQDHNNYVLGRVHNHSVVIACLPAGVDGNNAAAIVAANMLRTFKHLRFGLLVGIGGGIPNLDKGIDIRLGDVVVGQPDKTHGGVVQYDKGKTLEGGHFELKGSPSKPPPMLLTALSSLQAKYAMSSGQLPKYLSDATQKNPDLKHRGFAFPGVDNDHLHCTECASTSPLQRMQRCQRCNQGKVQRSSRPHTNPIVHYGTIASGNRVIKNAKERDRLGQEFGALCVEMEAAALVDQLPCLVIRGICDYADSYKNDLWHKYAAIAAAAYAKELLFYVAAQRAREIPRMADSVQASDEMARPNPSVVPTTTHASLEHNAGLNLFDAPDIDEDLFIGRETELLEMEQVLLPRPDAPGRRVLILGGMGGIGKTQLSISYAKRHRNSYSLIFWLNAHSETALVTSFRNVANRIMDPGMVSQLKDEELLVRVSNWLSDTDIRWLMIFDNYDDPDQYSIEEYYPPVAKGSVIITTRLPDRVNGKPMKLRPLADEESLHILSTRSERGNIDSDLGARRLARRLDGFPLALATAGAFLKQTRLTFEEYLQQYELKWKVSNRNRALPEYKDRTLYTTWTMSFDQIKTEDPRAACMLKLLAYFDNRNIWYALLAAGATSSAPPWFVEVTADAGELAGTMGLLAEYCLVETQIDNNSYSVHACVHDWLSNGIESTAEEREQLYLLAFDCVSMSITCDNTFEMGTFQYRPLTPHALRLKDECFSILFNDDALSHRPHGCYKIGALLLHQGHLDRADIMLHRALALYEINFGPDHINTIRALSMLGELYDFQGRFEMAQQMFKQALIKSEIVLGVEHPETLEMLHCIGFMYYRQGKLHNAEETLDGALAAYQRTSRSGNLEALKTLNTLGTVYMTQGRLDDAEQIWLRARTAFQNSNHHDNIFSHYPTENLALLYMRRGRLAESRTLLEEILPDLTRTRGYDNHYTLETKRLLQTVNRLIEAESSEQ